jgi:hypothetical protein
MIFVRGLRSESIIVDDDGVLSWAPEALSNEVLGL